MAEKKKIKKVTVFSGIVGGVLIVYSAFLIILLLWALMSSTKNAATFRESAISPEFPLDFTNYAIMLESFTISKWDALGRLDHSIFTQLTSSFLYAGGGALFQTICTAIVAYCTAKYKNWFSTLVNSLVLVTIALPIVGNMPSMVEVLRALQIYDTLVGMWIMKFGFINVYYFIFYAAFQGIAWDYAEAAFLDGATHFGVFFKIMVPMIMTLFGTVCLLFFITYWNDYQTPMIYWESHPTVAYGLYYFMHLGTPPEGVEYEVPLASNIPAKIAAGVVVSIPMFVIFIIFRNKLMGNLSEGGIKA